MKVFNLVQSTRSLKIGRRGMLLGAAAAMQAGAGKSWADDAANGIVLRADTARGGGLPGIQWDIHLVSAGNDDATDGQQDLHVKAITTASLAETLSPVRFRGTKLLQLDRNMWLSRPGLSKPIPISPRQRLSGQAANGDIAATNYASDYASILDREEMVGDEPCYVLNLVSRSRSSTYDKIVYWISKTRGVGVKADFMALSGKPLKSATFAYNNVIPFQGKSIPFISRMTIVDALTPATTTMDYSNVDVAALPAAVFDVANL